MLTIMIGDHAVKRYRDRIDGAPTYREVRILMESAASRAVLTSSTTRDGACIWEVEDPPLQLITKAYGCAPGYVKCVTVLRRGEQYESEDETIDEVIDAAARARSAKVAEPPRAKKPLEDSLHVADLERQIEDLRAKWKREATRSSEIQATKDQMSAALRAAVRGLLGLDDVETALAAVRAIDPMFATTAFADPRSFTKDERAHAYNEARYLAHMKHGQGPKEAGQ